MTNLERILTYFKTIASIPHCSREAGELREYLARFGQEVGYEVLEDSAGNLLMRRGKPKLCLQGHYDMVCVGNAPEIELIERERWLEARDSSLGADNGMAIAMMMALMEEGAELEFLLTADEEVGLVGAKALAFELQSPYLLNLDTEEAGEVYIGCAGGVDIVGRRSCERLPDHRPAWRVRLCGLPGGHSGVDIDKGIPNAIKELAQALAEDEELGLVSFVGGERRNSIPVHAEAVVRSAKRPEPGDAFDFTVEEAEDAQEGVFADSDRLLRLLATAPHGVVSRNEELQIPQQSLNLAQVDFSLSGCRIDYSLRAMSDGDLQSLADRTETLLHRYGFEVSREEAYPAWKPEVNEFTLKVAEFLKEEFGHSEMKAIHAGLECGILSQKYPQIKMASIGPTIENPHSVRERVDLESVERTFGALKKIIGEIE
ncbi:M20/M25/M40 family metallo-hydrolase [Nitratifractor salsuginis]|uniref:Xaa-His dipeptidase n=1 Tax=Nitratifractor salsuginis (strain DSM 16511 / JCM 12458 / E9I37-1) TaxID=749222 RepID=E6X087_NITSE|nr:M20/M25/M40 family metallo-hydrolase [Nitratifractor salsuginis]ADV45676.1 Xaa-His dipeptidase [Nitratifractor salsuginis DSM 16511]